MATTLLSLRALTARIAAGANACILRTTAVMVGAPGVRNLLREKVTKEHHDKPTQQMDSMDSFAVRDSFLHGYTDTS